jgi:hypothetical protein
MKRNMKASTSEPEPNQRLRSLGGLMLACAAVVVTVRVAVPLFTIDDGLIEQVDSLGFPEHVRAIVPLKFPDGAIVKPSIPDEPCAIVKLAGLEPVLMLKSGALMVSKRFVEVADAQLLSPEYRRLKVWTPVERGVDEVLTLKLAPTGALPARVVVASWVLPSKSVKVPVGFDPKDETLSTPATGIATPAYWVVADEVVSDRESAPTATTCTVTAGEVAGL